MIRERFPAARKVRVLSENMTQNTNSTTSEPMVGAAKTRPSSGVPRFDGAIVFAAISCLGKAERRQEAGTMATEDYPQQFSKPNFVSFEGRPGTGLSVMRVAPVLINPLGFFPLLTKSTT